jgi:hypothetical protein
MIGNILKLLSFVNIKDSELINQAKGKYEIPNTFTKLKRQIKWQSKR